MNTASRIIRSVPAIWKSWFLKSIKLIESDIDTFCGVRMNNGQIEMHYNPEYIKMLSLNELNLLIKHEVAHIVRGDILISPKDYIFELVNISQDAIINTHLGIDSLGNIKGYTIKGLQEIYDEIPNNPLSWRVIYNILKKNNHNSKQSFDKILKPEGDFHENSEALSEIIIDLIESDNDVINNVGISNNINITNISIKHTGSHLLEKIINEIESYGGTRFKRRTYRRENPASNLLKGVSRLPMTNIFVVADVSGSYVNYTETIIGLFHWLHQMNLIAKFGTFSDTFEVYDNISSVNKIKGYGGATLIKGLFEYLKTNSYDLVIIFTDGEIYDWSKDVRDMYKGDIIWVIDYKENFDTYSKNDKILLNDKVFNK